MDQNEYSSKSATYDMITCFFAHHPHLRSMASQYLIVDVLKEIGYMTKYVTKADTSFPNSDGPRFVDYCPYSLIQFKSWREDPSDAREEKIKDKGIQEY
mmetsp:Transcript_40453/g.56942  ORF Transcript_40453/g.56942 Transcript_40453/m.56942 type:complete len:99 (-) Transcript_40453:437-733(-)